MFIEADSTTLMRHAHMTAHDYLMYAISDIDEQLGKGYAKEHPELIAAYMQTAARDLHTAISSKALGEGLELIAETLAQIVERLPAIDD